MLILAYFFFDLRNFWKALNGQSGLNDKDTPNWVWNLYSIGVILFLVQHWVFASQYLRVALTFELAFSVKTEAVKEKKRRRDREILTVNIVAYSLLLVALLFQVIYPMQIIVLLTYTVTNIGMTACLTFSMVRLKNFSRLLVADGIVASNILITIHCLTFWIVSILDVISLIVNLFRGDPAAVIASQYLNVITVITFFAMMVTMLVMFVKFGTPLSSAEKTAYSMRLILACNADDFAQVRSGKDTEADELSAEQARAKRRYLHNQMMTDQLIAGMI